MKWFKHDSSAHIDAKLKKLKHKHGIVGYGLYWYCIELIALKVDAKNLSFELEEDAETIAIEWKLDRIDVQEIMLDMVNLGLFENDANGRITCLKLAKRLDDTNSRNPEIKAILSGFENKNSEATPTLFGNPRPDKNRLEENREDKPKRKESAWVCPPGINVQAWNEFEAHRKEMKKPLTNLARTKAANQIIDLSHDEQQRIIDRSIQARWTGLFPDNNKTEQKEVSYTPKDFPQG